MRSKFKWIFTLSLAFIMQLSFAQEKTVKGIVTDAQGPMPGVNVVVKGTQKGVSTGFDGSYAIKANVGDVLVYSFLSMSTVTRIVDASGVANVKMQDDVTKIETVVITALNVKKSERAVTYAAETIKGSTLTEARESNLVNALAGKTAGVNVVSSSGSVGASSRIVLRGNSTITGNNNALFVVDGVPFDNSTAGFAVGIANNAQAGNGGGRDLPNGVASINPDDIESMTVLKGPSAAALYGVRAAQGVIVITTKKGKKNQALGININSNISFSNPLVLPSYQNSYGQTGAPGTNFFQFTDGSGVTDDGVDESWGLPLDVGLNFVQWDSFKTGGGPKPWRSYKNNVKDFFDTGISIANTVSLSGGGESANFRFTAGQVKETGMVPFTDFQKFNISANGGLTLGKKVTANVNAMYFRDSSNNLPTVGYSGENVMQQFTMFSARNIDFPGLRDWRNLPLVPVGSTGQGAGLVPTNWNTQYQNNPYWVLENNLNGYERDRINGRVSIAYKITDKVTLSSGVAADNYSQVETTRQAFGSANTQFAAPTAAFGSFTLLNGKFSEINADVLLNYTDKITKDISFSLNGSTNLMTRVRQSIYAEAQNLQVPGIYNLSNVRSGTTPVYSNNYREQKINSVFGFGQISYKNWFFLDFSGRNDWSSLLADGNNSFFYPAISGSLVVTDALNLSNSNFPYIKLRAGYSKVGSLGGLTEYNLNDTVILTPNPVGSLGNIPNTEFNKGLRPETNTGVEFGLDLSAFNKRVRFGGTYYDQKNNDLIVPATVAPSSGFQQSWLNAASMRNKGMELQLGVTAVKTENFSFDVDLNFAKNENIVADLGGQETLLLGQQWGVTLLAKVGEPYGVLFGRDFQRDPSGNVIHLNGIPLRDDTQKSLGNIAPDWTGGANFNIRYKGFDFGTLIDAKIGGDIHSMSNGWGRYAGTLEETLVGRETGLVGAGVKSDGAGGFVPNDVVVGAQAYNQAAYGNGLESSSIFDASFVKLRQMNLGYSFNSKLFSQLGIDGLKVSVVARNLAILYKKVPHIDPETGFSSANGQQGQEAGQLPTARNIGFNVNIKF
jgi:TonB-linked SusC/RagA family outer membrane protein